MIKYLTSILVFIFISAGSIQAQQTFDQFFDSDGVPIHYKVIGDGPPVILIHGYAFNFEYGWQTVVPSLSKSFKVIGVDLRGHGKSGKPHKQNAYGMELANDVVRLMDHLKIQKAHIVGYSLGGMVALKLTASYPERIASVVLGGSGLYPKSWFIKAGSYVSRGLEKEISVAEAVAPDSIPLPKNAREMLVEYINTNDRRALISMINTTDKLAVSEDEATAITVPVLAVLGEKDDSIASVDYLAEVLPSIEIITIPGYSHWNAYTAPDFADAIDSFLLNEEKGKK